MVGASSSEKPLAYPPSLSGADIVFSLRWSSPSFYSISVSRQTGVDLRHIRNVGQRQARREPPALVDFRPIHGSVFLGHEDLFPARRLNDREGRPRRFNRGPANARDRREG